jgi:hypothetical protein
MFHEFLEQLRPETRGSNRAPESKKSAWVVTFERFVAVYLGKEGKLLQPWDESS